MATESVNEPKVSVHGIPQSQYEGSYSEGQPQQGSTGIFAEMKAHPIWAVSIAIGIIAILIALYIWWSNNNGSASTSSNIDPNTGLPVGTTTPDNSWGSQLDADYQQMMSFQNQQIGLLQQLLQQGQSSTGNNTTNNTGTTTGTSSTGTTSTTSTGTKSTNPPKTPAPTQNYYTVTGGDTLSSIAQKEGFGNWQSLYNYGTNAQTVQSTAKQHGYTSNYQNWIFPGEKLMVH